nr:hypothetical protein [Tanacetum cinerariifolium]
MYVGIKRLLSAVEVTVAGYVILNGDSPVSTRIVEGVAQPVALTTIEQKLARKNKLKARELSIKLSDRVLDLEKIMNAEEKEITDLKKRVKKLERKRRSRTLGMNLFKIGTFRRRSLVKDDASKQGRNLKQRSIFEESYFQAMMDANYELAARLRVEE